MLEHIANASSELIDGKIDSDLYVEFVTEELRKCDGEQLIKLAQAIIGWGRP